MGRVGIQVLMESSGGAEKLEELACFGEKKIVVCVIKRV